MGKSDQPAVDCSGGSRLAADIAANGTQDLPACGAQVAAVALAHAALREDAGHGVVDAVPAFVISLGRTYDLAVLRAPEPHAEQMITAPLPLTGSALSSARSSAEAHGSARQRGGAEDA